MYQDPRNYRISIGDTLVRLRGLAQERNCAMVTTKANRAPTCAREVDETAVAEDISKVVTADTIITYSHTDAENDLHLARLTVVTNSWYTEDGFSVVFTQSYATGQFCLDSARITSRYEDALKARREGPETEDLRD
jgi:hypothetical protein